MNRVRLDASTQLIVRAPLHRAVFVAAGVYNMLWGLSTLVEPQWMYRITGGATPDRAEMASAIGLVVGLYGVLYLYVAFDLAGGWLIAAVGLAGKILGPIGMLTLVSSGSWPTSSLWICVMNDFIWWAPFALYLHDAWPAFHSNILSNNGQWSGRRT